MKKEIPIMFCYDKNYVIPAAVAFYSLMEHASKDYNYILYTLHSDISNDQQEKLKETVLPFKNCKLEFINMEHKLDDFWNKNYKGGHFSKEVMYKLLVASIFPNINKIIVSDVDVVFLGDVSQSYFDLNDSDDAYIAGVKPIGKISNYLRNYANKWTEDEISKLGNVCGGYLIMNLKKIREDNFEEVFLKSLEENGSRLNQMEQDIFNITCYGKIKHLHLKYVACSYMWDYYKNDYDKKTDTNYSFKEINEAMKHPVQLHYATSIKPWKNVDCTLSVIWFKYIVKTPFAEEYFKQLPETIVVKHNEEPQKISFVNRVRAFFDSHNNLFFKIIRKILKVIKILLKNPFVIFKKSFYVRLKRKLLYNNIDLIIFDDVFPCNLSPFRYEEYVDYLKCFNNSFVAATGSTIAYLNKNTTLKYEIDNFEKNFPNLIGKILDVSTINRNENLKIISELKHPFAVMDFIQNLINPLYDNLSFFEKNNIPFLFTLYPGGGFIINNKESDDKLKRICSSKCFTKVIVTQTITREYLINNNICPPNKIEFIFGIVTPKMALEVKNDSKCYYGSNKKTLDIAFVAHKYSKDGKDKGYDLFIKMAKKIANKYENIKFHVVGGFTGDEYDISNIHDKIIFHGILNTEDLTKLYNSQIDIIVSPTRPFKLSKGSFDGFPTGSSTEAMINGVLLIATDELKLNNDMFKDGKDLIIIKPNENDIIKNIEHFYNNPRLLRKIALRGSKRAKKIYSYSNQMGRRIKLIKKSSKVKINNNF